MSVVVKFHELDMAFESPDEWVRVFDREKGEILMIDDDTMRLAQLVVDADDEGGDGDNYESPGEHVPVPDWQRKAVDQAAAYLRAEETGAGDFVELPSKWDFHEYRRMEEFIESLPSGQTQQRLWHAIEGRGAFRRFKDEAGRIGVLEGWYEFRDQAVQRLLTDWAASQGIEIDFSPPVG